MSATLDKAFGYKGDTMNLPVADVASALPFYETILGFRVESRSDTPAKSAVLVRDHIQIRLAENGGDPSQDGCAFHVTGIVDLFAEFNRNGLGKGLSTFSTEQRNGKAWKVFYVVPPDGLCYWFGEQQFWKSMSSSRLFRAASASQRFDIFRGMCVTAPAQRKAKLSIV